MYEINDYVQIVDVNLSNVERDHPPNEFDLRLIVKVINVTLDHQDVVTYTCLAPDKRIIQLTEDEVSLHSPKIPRRQSIPTVTFKDMNSIAHAVELYCDSFPF